MLCFASGGASDSAEELDPTYLHESALKSGLSIPQDIFSGEEPFSSPGSMSPPFSPGSQGRRTWDDPTLEPVKRALLAIEHFDSQIFKETIPTDEKLLELFTYIDPIEGDTISHAIARAGNDEVLRILLAHPMMSEVGGSNLRRGAFLNSTNRLMETPLHAALGAGNHSTAYLFLTSGADPWMRNYNRETGLYLACYCGAIEVVDHILKSRGCTPAMVQASTGDGLSPMNIALARGNTAVVDLLNAYVNGWK